MFPLYDESHKYRKPPYLTITIIAINILISVFTFFFINLEEFDKIVFNYGAIPSQITTGENLVSLLTSMFLHAGIAHLIGNMWFLWVFGDNIEHSLGKVKFIIFYFLTGIIASLIHIYTSPLEYRVIPTIGASGAISGLLGGYVVLFPRNRIRAFIMLYFRPILFYVPAFIYVGIWFLYQILYMGAPTMIAYMAHIGGFVAGMVLVKLFQRKKKIF